MLWFIIWSIAITYRYKQEILSSWQEPVLKHPVLIFESDDWGAGPLIQDKSLGQIISILERYCDKQGHHPVMTLGVVLSIPDTKKIKSIEYKRYFEKKLDDFEFEKIKGVMLKGLEQGIFDLQLHGMAHYWPDNVMYALQTDAHVRDWLNEADFSVTETLPSVLQSRWTNTKTLPTTPLKDNEVSHAIKEEVNMFTQIFGFIPKVAVPPTFVWTPVVENRWHEHGLEYLTTPGHCCNLRDENGVPVVDEFIRLARGGAGWHSFMWQKPSSACPYGF